MKAVLLHDTEFGGKTLAAGLHEVTDAEFYAISSFAPIRPATVADLSTEAAVAAPAPERATAKRGRRRPAEEDIL